MNTIHSSWTTLLILIGIFAMMLLLLWKVGQGCDCDERKLEARQERKRTCVQGLGWPK